MLTQVPTFNFNFNGCDEVVNAGVVHALPANDTEPHDVTGTHCACGCDELRIGNTLLAVVHKPFDKSDAVDKLFESETFEEAKDIRREYEEENNFLLRKGKINKKSHYERWLAFNTTFEDIFRVN